MTGKIGVIVREEHRLRFLRAVCSGIFGSKKGSAEGEWRKIHY
jgi:hypothetical protein